MLYKLRQTLETISDVKDAASRESALMCLPSRAAQPAARRWGFPPADWWRWSSRRRNPSALDCGEPRTPAETQQRFSQPCSSATHPHICTGRETQGYSLSCVNDAKCRKNNNRQALYIILALAVVRPLDLIQEVLRLKTKTKPKPGY